MATNAATLIALYPQYATDTRIDVFLGLAALQVGSVAWGAYYQLGVVNLAAHMMIVADRGASPATAGIGGAIASVSEGQSSISFGQASVVGATMGDAALMSTSAGLEYLRLRGMLPARTFTWVR